MIKGHALRIAWLAGASLLIFGAAASAQEGEDAEGSSLTDAQKAVIAAAAAREAVAKAEQAEADASKAASQAEAEAVAAKFGPLGDVENEGKVTTDTTSGKLEGTLLAAAATRAAGDVLGKRLCLVTGGTEASCASPGQPAARPTAVSAPPPDFQTVEAACASLSYQVPVVPQVSPRPIVFVAEAENANFDVAEAFLVRVSAIGRNICQALRLAREATKRTAPLLDTRRREGGNDIEFAGGGFGIAGAATALDTVAKLFRTEYTIASIDFTEDDLLLIKETMLAFLRRRPGTPVYAPDLFPLTPAAANNPVVEKITAVDRVMAAVVEESAVQGELERTFSALAEQVGDEDAPKVAAASELHKSRAAALDSAVAEYTTFISAASEPGNDKPAALPTALRQGRTVQLLREGGLLVVAKMNMLGASTYTKRNFWTAFGGMPFYVSGGTLVSYSVMDGSTGQVIDAVSLPVAGGFHRANDVHRLFRPASADGADGRTLPTSN